MKKKKKHVDFLFYLPRFADIPVTLRNSWPGCGVPCVLTVILCEPQLSGPGSEWVQHLVLVCSLPTRPTDSATDIEKQGRAGCRARTLFVNSTHPSQHEH